MHELTIQRLKELEEQFKKDFPPSRFDKGVDMSGATFNGLTRIFGIAWYSRDGGVTWFDPHKMPLIGVEIHIVPEIPFGEVEPCRCAERKNDGLNLSSPYRQAN